MTKRSAGHLMEDASHDEGQRTPAKRPKLQSRAAALALLESHADQLIDCLQSFKAGRISSQGHQLENLSHTLLPAFEVLGTRIDGKQEHKAIASKAVEAQSIDQNHESVGERPVLTKWDMAEIPASRPCLPKVLDPAIEKAALTHSGTIKDNQSLSYERLEWIGDAYLYLIASSFIYQTFTNLPPGKCSQLREQLVRNSTLGQYTRQYGLDKRAVFPPEFYDTTTTANRASEKERRKALGDLFEAYVGAIILSDPRNGVARASSWLKALWGTTIVDQLREESLRSQPGSNGLTVPSLGSSADTAGPSAVPLSISLPGKAPALPKVRLAAEIACGKVASIEYGDIDLDKPKKDKRTNLPLFTVGCYFTGWGDKRKLLGTGTDLSKKDAGQKAAQKALENKKMIQTLTEKKQRFLAEREAAEGKPTKEA